LNEIFSYLDLASKVQQEFISNIINTTGSYLLSLTVPANNSLNLQTISTVKAYLKGVHSENIYINSQLKTNNYAGVIELLLISSEIFIKKIETFNEVIKFKTVVPIKNDAAHLIDDGIILLSKATSNEYSVLSEIVDLVTSFIDFKIDTISDLINLKGKSDIDSLRDSLVSEILLLNNKFSSNEYSTVTDIISAISDILSSGVAALSDTLNIIDSSDNTNSADGTFTEMVDLSGESLSSTYSTVTDILNLIDSILSSGIDALSETIDIQGILENHNRADGSLNEVVNLSSETLSNMYASITDLYLLVGNLISSEVYSISDTAILSGTHNSPVISSYLIEDIIKLNEILTLISSLVISDTLGINDSFLTDDKDGSGQRVFLSLLDTLLILDKSGYALLSSISENLEFSLVMSSLRLAISNITDNLLLDSQAIAGSLFLVPVTDSLNLESLEDISSILQELLSEELLLLLPQVDNSAKYLTYAFSPETASVSTYDNYNFEGACVFNGKYLFFNKNGIFEYGGNFDDGVPIQSEISTSALMYSTSNLKNVPSVYLGVVNSDVVILKVRTDGKGEFTYKLNKHTSNLHTQKINIGKGVIGRYFQFDLITSSEEFNLNSIEFLPLVLKRKI
jgi:hypothetical protein